MAPEAVLIPPAEAIEQASRLLHSGRVKDAETLCRRVLAADAGNARALNLLGIIASHGKRSSEGVNLFQRAIAADGGVAEFHNNLGNAHSALGRRTDAIAAYVAALGIDPGCAEAYDNLGQASAEMSLPELTRFAQGVSVGIALGRLAGQRAQVRPHEVPGARGLGSFYRELASALHDAEAFEAACSCLEAAATWAPDDPHVLNNLAAARTKVVRDFDALTAAERAVEQAPQVPEAHSNLATVLNNVGRFAAAVPHYRRAIELGSQSKHLPKFWDGLGATLGCLGQLAEAVQACSTAISIDPGYARAHINRGLLLLKGGQLTAGWAEYEWRHELPDLRSFPWLPDVPRWRGEDLRNKTIVLLTEQGLGDSIHFIRYAPLLAQRGARVVVVCEPELRRLLGSVEGVYAANVPGELRVRVTPDFQCRMLSLPLGFGTTLATIPAEVPYVRADPTAVESWAKRLGPQHRMRVGLVWAGKSRPAAPGNYRTDRRRSFPLATYAPLFEVPDVEFFSLQRDAAMDDVGLPPQLASVTPYPADSHDFLDLAPLIANLDLVITVDTSIAHLAGAMAKPVWVLSRYDACWRWLLDRDDSPWYPTMRLFRQLVPGDWATVIARVKQALELEEHRRNGR